MERYRIYVDGIESYGVYAQDQGLALFLASTCFRGKCSITVERV
jgi:hypothetical protein